MLTRLTLTAAAMALTASVAAAQAPANPPLTGTIKALSQGSATVTTATGDVMIMLTPQTRVTTRVPVAADEIKPGSYLGTANLNTGEGGVANEVHLGPNGNNVPNTPMGPPNLVMTNGHVTAVKTTAAGKEMEVDYGGAQTRKIVVPATAPVTQTVPAELKVGASVTVRGAMADGMMTANTIQVAAPK